MQTVLLVEDDRLLNDQLAAALRHRYRVLTAHSLAVAYELLDKNPCHLAVLDRMLPDGDSLELVSYLRDCSPATRILLLSRRGEIDQRIAGLEAGADDYLAKPFEYRELLLRVKRLAAMEHIFLDAWQELGRLRYRHETGETYDGTRPIHLRPRESQILSCLFKYRNQVVTRSRIIADVWGSAEIPSETTLDVYLRRLRMLLGDSAQYIQTVRGYGYIIRDPRGNSKIT